LLKSNPETIQVAEGQTCFPGEPHAFRRQHVGQPWFTLSRRRSQPSAQI